jgi:hypothetical protein
MLVCWYASAQVEILPPIFIRVHVFFTEPRRTAKAAPFRSVHGRGGTELRASPS